MPDIYYTDGDGRRVAVSAANPLPVSGGGGGGGPVDWEDVENKPAEFPPASHTHAAGDITSGTLAVARVPSLAISKITGLQGIIDDLTSRIEALEA